MLKTQRDTNFGSSTILQTDGSGKSKASAYLRFNVQGLTGTVTKAAFWVFVNAGSTSATGFDLRKVGDNSWGELSITFNNAPTVGSLVTSSGAIAGGTWVSLDVTQAIAGNGPISFAMVGSTTGVLTYGSRESGANAPQLVIQTTGARASVAPNPGTSNRPVRLLVAPGALVGLASPLFTQDCKPKPLILTVPRSGLLMQMNSCHRQQTTAESG